MSLTLAEICDKIKNNYDELLICEMLDITAEDLVDRFDDRVADRYDELMEELEDDYDE